MIINLRLDIEPKALPRPKHASRGGFVSSYYKKDTYRTFDIYTEALNQALERLDSETRHFIKGMVEKPPEGLYIIMDVTFNMPIPKSWSKTKKAYMVGKYHTNKPDRSNLLKMIEDRAEGIFYHDDKIVVDGNHKKIYSDRVGIDITLNYEVL